MEFAKLRSGARFNLATSGVMGYPLAELPVRLKEFEINGPTLYGYAPLQERLARKNDVSPDCVVAAAGTSMANHIAMAAAFEPGDEVLVEQPTYELLLRTVEYLGGNIKRFSRRFEEQFRLDPAEVEKQVSSETRLIVITNLHNPSGALASHEALAEIGEIARRVRARVLVDEVYLEALFEQAPRSAFHLGHEFIVTSSLTKAYGLSGIRCGWVLAEPELAERMWRINDLYGATPVHVGELLSVIALDNLGKVAKRAKAILKKNREALDRLLNTRIELEYFRPEFGTIIFPKLQRGNAEQFLDLLARKYETSVVPGGFFEMPQHFRLGIGGDPEMTREGLERLGRALEEF